MKYYNRPNECMRVLVVDESDPMGAGGIQGDIKTVLALGGYATTAISFFRSENGVIENPIKPDFIAQQMRTALKEIETDAIKIGFLPDEVSINAVADVLDELKAHNIPVVVDPTIISKSREAEISDEALAAWKRRLYIHAKILTPNLKEAELLGVMKINDIDDMRHAADMMRTLGAENVVLKGGQADSDKELYFIATAAGERIYERPTLKTPHTIGAGSAFSAALAINMAKNMDIFESVENALDFIHQAIFHSNGFGHEIGPINPAFDIQRRPSVFHPEEIRLYNQQKS